MEAKGQAEISCIDLSWKVSLILILKIDLGSYKIMNGCRIAYFILENGTPKKMKALYYDFDL
jgi:hypothetical protein